MPRKSDAEGAAAADVDVQPASFPPLAPGRAGQPSGQGLELLQDVDLQITAELGRASMPLREVLDLGPGSVVELDKLAGEPVDVLINHRLVARGEVIVIEDMFGVRITELVAGLSRDR